MVPAGAEGGSTVSVNILNPLVAGPVERVVAGTVGACEETSFGRLLPPSSLCSYAAGIGAVTVD